LETSLRAIGFIAGPLPGPKTGLLAQQAEVLIHPFLAGDQFLSLLAFTGCAVHVHLAPPSKPGPFTHVSLVGPASLPRFLWGRNTRPPRCPQCRSPHHGWSRGIQPPDIPNLTCTDCGLSQPCWTWDWKAKAGYGRSFIAVEEIFPSEAEPSPALLAALADLTLSPWRRFYIQD